MIDPPQVGEAPGLEVSNLHVHYGPICALHGISFSAPAGRSVALLGGNGAGKSTLMKCVVGLVAPGTGEVRWKGQPVSAGTGRLAFLPQRADISWSFPITVRGLVEMGRYPHLGLWSRFGGAHREAVDLALERMKIAGLAKRQIGALSGGQQQRALIARALAMEAEALLLDEPFAGLDQPAQDLLADLLRDLVAKGHLVMASHHDLKSVEAIFDEAILLNGGLIARGRSAEVVTEENLAKAFGRPE
ncbi:MAG TPA: metal ABC transporter ATP-binding protein [Kiritimatiellia bacterium]|nr:metal ABC transporter ATP-binding protein [Kiritimatiellia bacterium]